MLVIVSLHSPGLSAKKCDTNDQLGSCAGSFETFRKRRQIHETATTFIVHNREGLAGNDLAPSWELSEPVRRFRTEAFSFLNPMQAHTQQPKREARGGRVAPVVSILGARIFNVDDCTRR